MIHVYATRTDESKEDLFQEHNLLEMTKEVGDRACIKETNFELCENTFRHHLECSMARSEKKECFRARTRD